MLNTDIIKQWIELDALRKSHEADIEDIKTRMSFLEEVILENFASEGIDSCKINGYTVGPAVQIFATIIDGDKDRAFQALKNSNYGQYIQETCNMRSLSTLVSDLMKEDGKLPEEFIGAIGVFEKTRLKKKKS